MIIKKIIIALFISLFLISSTNASEEKIGKFLGAKHTNMPSWFLNSFLDFSEDIEELSYENKRLILFLHQDSCPYCNRFVTKNLANKKIQEKINTHFGIVDINMFGSKQIKHTDNKIYTEKEFAKKLNVQFTPTLIFFNEKGKKVLRLNGYLSPNEFNIALDFVRNKKEKEISYSNYLAQRTLKAKEGSLIFEKDLFNKSNNFYKYNRLAEFAIFFEAKQCKNCDTLHNKLLKDKLTRSLLKKIDIYQVDINSNDFITSPNNKKLKIKTWIKDLDITYTPSIIFFDKEYNEIIRIESSFKNFHFQSIVDYVVSGEYKNEKEFQRYLTKRVDKIREKGIDVDIWK